ncbi:hypothetical protein NP493_245g02024 [Ridgeia piscesae]|uniref:Fibronectin type-III domain-containing protein n=1 Tax=Ridgeia piscesae TaxID=27915 RepID=A0AAD9UDC5_RIDPI|nr:hypothetical protein NP493_245g02024 [Ridgeia piscesae]
MFNKASVGNEVLSIECVHILSCTLWYRDRQKDGTTVDTDKLIQDVIETIDLAKTHKIILSQLEEKLQDAHLQVQQSSELAQKKLQETFAGLKKSINETLDTRLQLLEAQIDQLTSDARSPLVKAEDVLKDHNKTASDLLDEGLKLLMSDDHAAISDKMKQFKARSQEVTIDGLPEVPALCDVSYITVELPPDIDQQVTSLADNFGRIMSRSPVQVTSIREQPGGLVVTWAEVDEDQPTSFSEFKLEYCSGVSGSQGNQKLEFIKAYQGPHLGYTLRHLKPFTYYSMRVCGRVEETTPWCVWSVPAVAMTRLQPYEWRDGVDGYCISNENKMATCCKDVEKPLGLYSTGQLYTCGHSVAFRIVDVGQACASDGIALTVSERESEPLNRPGSVFVSVSGTVYMDGVEKLTRLPPLTRGTMLTFDTESLLPGKIRVSIDVAGKIVTFDWVIEDASSNINSMQQTDNDIELFFVMAFSYRGWKVGVE